MRVVVYHNSVPGNKSQEKIDILKNFSIGVKAAKDICVDNYTYSIYNGDVSVIQGWITETSFLRRHLLLRHDVINHTRTTSKYVVSADSNLFLYSDVENPHHYLRYSFNGVFPTTGIYCDSIINECRWKQISKDLNITLKDYKTLGNHILLCLQRNGGWSMGEYDVQRWAINTINTLRMHTDRPIVLRGHPGDKLARVYLNPNSELCKITGYKNVYFSEHGKSLIDDLDNCWAVVNHNSSPVVGAAIEGYPIFVTDPDKSQCKEIANLKLEDIEHPMYPDRQKWVERISMFHWNFEDLKKGECWRHMRQFITNV